MLKRFYNELAYRHKLILLGMFCQGYIFNNHIIPVLYLMAGIVAVKFYSEKKTFLASMEELLIVGAIVVSFWLSGSFNVNRFLFIGNSLIIFQLLRLNRPLSPREEMYSIVVALIHLSVGAQVIVDYPFIIIFGMAVYLIPNSLMECVCFANNVDMRKLIPFPKKHYFIMVIITIVIFLVSPRFQVFRFTGKLSSGYRSQNKMDMAKDGPDDTNKSLLFRISGDKLRYVRRYTLDTWDGVTWVASPMQHRLNYMPSYRDIPGARKRVVQIIEDDTIDYVLPVDGFVTMIKGPFSRTPGIAEFGAAITTQRMKAGSSYEYWSLDYTPADDIIMSRRSLPVYLNLNHQSPELVKWLDELLKDAKSKEDIIETLIKYFQDNHQYELGVPALDRLSPVDDFIFNKRSGHCERFASAMAVLLRLKGIPSRIALGWVASEYNDLTGFYNIRANNAHAWTEAWISEKGWVNCDATPVASNVNTERRSYYLTISEWIEFVWYSKIVSFSSIDQESLGTLVNGGFKGFFALISKHFVKVLILLVVLTAITFIIRISKGIKFNNHTVAKEDSLKKVRNFYADMLRLLRKQGIKKSGSVTPNEFACSEECLGHKSYSDIIFITKKFCDVSYGDSVLSNKEEYEIKDRLAKIKK